MRVCRCPRGRVNGRKRGELREKKKGSKGRRKEEKIKIKRKRAGVQEGE